MWGHVPGWWTVTRGPGEVSGWVDTLRYGHGDVS